MNNENARPPAHSQEQVEEVGFEQRQAHVLRQLVCALSD